MLISVDRKTGKTRPIPYKLIWRLGNSKFWDRFSNTPVPVIKSAPAVFVHAPNHLGDCVMALPFISRLQDLVGQRLTIVSRTEYMEIWKLLPRPVHTICYPGWYSSVRRTLRRKISGKSGTVAFLLATGMEVAWFYLICGVKHRIGYDFWGRGWLLTARLHSDGTPTSSRLTSEHHSYNMLRLLALASDDRPYRMQASEPRLDRMNRGAVKPLKIGIVVGGNTADKRFSLRFWSTVVKKLSMNFPVGCIELFGCDEHVELGAEISRENSSCRNLCGTTTIGDLIGKLPQCSLLISPDTGTAHLAALLDIPTIVIFTSGSPVWTRPRGPSVTVIRPDIPCSPCFGTAPCPFGHGCTRAVRADQVATTALELLASNVIHNRDRERGL